MEKYMNTLDQFQLRYYINNFDTPTYFTYNTLINEVNLSHIAIALAVANLQKTIGYKIDLVTGFND